MDIPAQKATPEDASSQIAGGCLCGSVRWQLPLTGPVAQVLVCHCASCRRFSGSVSIPYVALPKSALAPQMEGSAALKKFRSSTVAARGFCGECGSSLFMDYGEEHTLWIPMGTIERFDPALVQADATRHSNIYMESKAEYADALDELPKLRCFGTYRPDPCQDKPFESLPTWEETGSIAQFVQEQQQQQ
eukprot:NODE_4244_length_838_cov_47.643853_g3918_i0.p1 GENE.NODE_4244_length_838_cov_47.643853_g3918_i0~~NODE_4244_length_838_cov_47.643853_g3918_i0.p1  ORF type:complete len:221 (-),score=52.15 NODE_4244_length_838_cov_47.643853_g3918_i0:176-745(-)